MAVFSTNQSRQLYVVSNYVDSIDKLSNVGDVAIGCDSDSDKANLYFATKGYGGIVRSDLIPYMNITELKGAVPADTNIKGKQTLVALNQDCNEGKLVLGEDYILRINFRQLYGMSDGDIYQKYGAVHVTSAMVATPGKFWVAMAYSLFKNFHRTYTPLLDVALAKDGVTTVITSIKYINGNYYINGSTTAESTFDYKGLVIVEKDQTADWHLGTAQYTPVYFEVIPTTVYVDGDDTTWGVTSDGVIDNFVPNGYKYADLEYFCMGERGDQYRELYWPNNIKTRYMVDPEKEYYSIDIYYYACNSNEGVQKSEKDITIISENLDVIKTIVIKLNLQAISSGSNNFIEEMQ